MSRPPFHLPIPGPCHQLGWNRPAGNDDFRLTQTFDHVNKAISSLPHGGLDFGNGRTAPAPVYAIAAGVVDDEGWLLQPWSYPAPADKRSSWGPNYGGVMVAIRHDDHWASAYAHLSRSIVDKGQKVRRGQLIGYTGGTGSAAGVVHLHLDVYHDGRKVDGWPLLHRNYRKVGRDLRQSLEHVAHFELKKAIAELDAARARLTRTEAAIAGN